MQSDKVPDEGEGTVVPMIVVAVLTIVVTLRSVILRHTDLSVFVSKSALHVANGSQGRLRGISPPARRLEAGVRGEVHQGTSMQAERGTRFGRTPPRSLPGCRALRPSVESVAHEKSPEPPVRGSGLWKRPDSRDESGGDDYDANEVDTYADGQNRESSTC